MDNVVYAVNALKNQTLRVLRLGHSETSRARKRQIEGSNDGKFTSELSVTMSPESKALAESMSKELRSKMPQEMEEKVFLQLLSADLKNHPEKLTALDASLITRIDSLVGNVEIDLYATFPTEPHTNDQ